MLSGAKKAARREENGSPTAKNREKENFLLPTKTSCLLGGNVVR